MKKETFKSVLLTALVLLSIFLTVKIWFNEKLWPEGYNFFKLPSFSTQVSMPKENLSKPRRIVVASDKDSVRSVLYNSDQRFDSLFGEIRQVFYSFLSGDAEIKKQETLDGAAWRQVMEYDSLFQSAYVNFPIAYAPRVFAQIMGAGNATALDDLSSVQNFLILAGDGNDLSILAMDAGNQDKIIRYQVAYGNIGGLVQAIEAAQAAEQSTCFIAFEYGLDEPFSPTDEALKTTVDPYVIINDSNEELTTATVRSTNPLNMQDETIFNSIIQQFGYNPHSIRRYVDDDDTVVYVENYSSLKVYKDGFIEYAAVQPEKGFEINRENRSSMYECLNSAIEFTEGIWQLAMPDKPINVCLSSNLVENTAGSRFLFTFDYYIEGTQVVVDVSQHEAKHAVEIEVMDGRVTKFSLFLRDYAKVRDDVLDMTMLQAIDEIYEQYNTGAQDVVIQDIFMCFFENGTGLEQKTRWAAKINGADTIVK